MLGCTLFNTSNSVELPEVLAGLRIVFARCLIDAPYFIIYKQKPLLLGHTIRVNWIPQAAFDSL